MPRSDHARATWIRRTLHNASRRSRPCPATRSHAASCPTSRIANSTFPRAHDSCDAELATTKSSRNVACHWQVRKPAPETPLHVPWPLGQSESTEQRNVPIIPEHDAAPALSTQYSFIPHGRVFLQLRTVPEDAAQLELD